MPEKSLRLGLFDPGMTHLHRVGLAGLYMTLSSIEEKDFADAGGWNLDNKGIEIFWNNNPKQLIEPIIEKSFLVKDDLIDFYAHKESSIGDLEKIILHNAIMQTFLQHGRTRKTRKKEQNISISFDNKAIIQKIKPLLEYNNQKVDAFKLFDGKGNFKKSVNIAGWLFPGGVVRHVAYPNTGSE